MAEAEGYYQLLQEQVQDLSSVMNSTEEANQLRTTAKDMLEALRQCISIIKESELVETSSTVSGLNSLEPTPPPEEQSAAAAASAATTTTRRSASAEAGPVASMGVQRSPAVQSQSETAGGDLRCVIFICLLDTMWC